MFRPRRARLVAPASAPVRRAPAPSRRRPGIALSPAALTLVAVLFALPFSGPATAQAVIDIDTADAAALAEHLPGIGPVKARRIVEHRERHGPFGTLDALEAVKGIGPATLERIRAHLAGTSSPGPDARGVPRATAPGARSTTELERATRTAVRAVVAEARRDAERARGGAAQ